MKKLIDIVIECNHEDEKIDNMCVDEYIKYLKNENQEKPFIVVDSLSCIDKKNINYEDLALKMKAKLLSCRNKNRAGWWQESCSVELLTQLYFEHKEKKNKDNEIDLCNFSMFIHFKNTDKAKELLEGEELS